MFPPRVNPNKDCGLLGGGSQRCKHRRHTQSEANKHQKPQTTTHHLLARVWREVTSIWGRQANTYTQRRHDFAQLLRCSFLLLRVGSVRIVRVYWRVRSAGHSFASTDAQKPDFKKHVHAGWRGDLVSGAKKQAHAKFLAKVDAQTLSLGVVSLPIPGMVSRLSGLPRR